jgi:hypothetical protein
MRTRLRPNIKLVAAPGGSPTRPKDAGLSDFTNRIVIANDNEFWCRPQDHREKERAHRD